MKQSIKLHTLSISIATAIVLAIWAKLPELKEISETLDNNILKVLIGVVASATVYKTSIEIVLYIAKKVRFVKKILLGSAYMEGTWVGFYIGAGGNVRFFVEKFEQEIDSLVIRGHSYNHNGQYHAWWVAESVVIDTTIGKISYMYDCEAINDNGNHNGVAVFNFVDGNYKIAPKKLIGFSSDIHIGVRTRSMEIKISCDSNLSLEEALPKAIELYEANQNNF